QGEACPTISSLDAKQDRANIAKSSTFPHESTSRVPSLAADEGTLQLRIQELTDLCTSLQKQQSEMVAKFKVQELEINSLKARIKVLEDKDRGVSERSGDDAPIKGRSGVAKVPTGSGSIPTAGPPATEVTTSSDVVPTAGQIFATATVVTPYTRRKGKEKMIESETPEKKKIQEQMDIQMAIQLEEEMERDAQRMNEQIARDAEIARIHAEEELRIELISDLVRYQDNYAKAHKYQSQQRKPHTKKQHREFYTLVLRNQARWKAKDFKGMTLEEIKENFDPVWEQIHDFIPIGLKEEAERFKRKGIRFEQESVKMLKTSEEVKSSEEVPEEKVKAMMQLVPIEEHLDREDLNQLWRLVKESLSIRPAASDKEMELWVELKRLYEPDDEDQLWTHIQNLMHAPVEWMLYDMCGVHHVTSKDKEMFMLVEKDYPLRKGLAIVMISYKHQAFPLPVMEFPLPGEVPTASEESSHCQKKRDATAEKIALLLKSSSNCQSKSYDSYAKFVPHV
nr:hypothetical protein [Tanacetum cinerariifolium]